MGVRQHLLNACCAACRYVHGDIKPENLLLGAPDTPNATRLYMVDLGLAQKYTSSTARHLPYHQNPNEFRSALHLSKQPCA